MPYVIILFCFGNRISTGVCYPVPAIVYTTPDMKNYKSSKEILNRVMEVEKKEGLNGHLILVHFGTDNLRTDKFYKKPLTQLIRNLQNKGYKFVPLLEALGYSSIIK